MCEGSDTPFGISTDDQVRNCQVFYHDHCLLGIENNSSTDDPDQDSQVTPCVKAIQTIAACQKAGTALGDCIDSNADGGGGAGPISILDSSITTPCQALLSPETIEACNFVALPPADASQ